MNEQPLIDRTMQSCDEAVAEIVELFRERKNYTLTREQKCFVRIGVEGGYRHGFNDAIGDAQRASVKAITEFMEGLIHDTDT